MKKPSLLRSLIFSLVMMIVTFFYSFFCLAAKPFPFRYRYAIIMAWNIFIIKSLKKICHVNYEIEGLENIPKDRVGVILCKHQSAWETFLVPTLFHHAAIILKRELLWVPFFGWGLSLVDPIAIDRKNPSSAMDQIIKQGKQCLENNRWILVFPEGTRIAPGHTGKYRLGGTRLATATGSPVIPIAHNAGRFWPKRGFLKRPGTVKLIIGPLIETVNRTPEAVLEEAKTWIETTVQRIGG
jgi:1-acyl-sn-glycerol-3-phosphate acyltransferase